MQRDKTIREIIIESSIIISSMLIFFGFLKQYWFYNHFGVKIQNFLSIEEIIIMFLGELPFVLKCLLGIVLYYIFIISIFKIYCFKKDAKNSTTDTEKDFYNAFDEFFNIKKNLLIILIATLFLCAICTGIFYYTHSEFAIVYLALMFCQTLYILFDIFEFEIDEQLKHFCFLLLGLSILLYCKNVIDIDKITYETKSIKCKLLNNDKTTIIKPYILLGKTKDFLFLLDKCSGTTKVIKVENFIELEIKKY